MSVSRPMTFEWKPGARYPVKAQVAGETVEKLCKEHGVDEITPATLVDASRPADAPLHRCFEWDKDVASQKWNEHQARHILHSIVIVSYVGEKQEPKRSVAYVSVTNPEGNRVYTPMAKAMSVEEQAEEVVANALVVFMGFKARYEHIKEMRGFLDVMDREARKLLDEMKAKAAAKAKSKTKDKPRKREPQPVA